MWSDKCRSTGVLLAALTSLLLLTSGHVHARFAGPTAHISRQVETIVSPLVPQAERTSDVVGIIVSNISSDNLQNQPVSFGQVFIPGKVPHGAQLIARIDGLSAPAQLDEKVLNPDGSVRMGVVTILVPNLMRGDSVPVMLSIGTLHPATNEIVASSKQYNLVVDISVHGGQTYHLDAADLMAAALREKTASYWLRGPLASEVRVEKALTGSLHVTFDIRRFLNGKALTDVAVRNDYALRPLGGPISYDVTISGDGKTEFSQQNVEHQQYTTWHKLIGVAGPSSVLIVHDIAALERSGAILDYDLTNGIDRNLLRRNSKDLERGGFGILENAGMAWYMGMVGGRSELGPTTRNNVLWLLTQDEQAQAFALAQADGGGTIPWHFYDSKDATYLTATRYPDLWTDQRASRIGLRSLTQQIKAFAKGCNCFFLDAAHQPDLFFVPYILTGERYYLDQLEAQATWDVIGANPRMRQRSNGIVFYPEAQARAAAWSFRGIINAGWIIPDDDSLQSYFRKIQRNNLEYVLRGISKLNEGEVSGWLVANAYSSDKGVIAPWQQDYIAYIMALAAKRGDTQALEVLKWETNFLAGRFLSGSRGFSPYDGVAYRIATFSPPDQVKGAYKTWLDVGKATIEAGFSGGGQTWPRQAYPEYLLAAKGVLASIVRLTGSDKARQAYQWLDVHGEQASATKDQQDPTFRVALPN